MQNTDRYATVYYATICRIDGSIVRTIFDYDYTTVMIGATIEWQKIPEAQRGDIVVNTRNTADIVSR